jgi:hypothetical protein
VYQHRNFDWDKNLQSIQQLFFFFLNAISCSVWWEDLEMCTWFSVVVLKVTMMAGLRTPECSGMKRIWLGQGLLSVWFLT